MRRISSLKMLGLALYGSVSQKRNNPSKYFIAAFGSHFKDAKPKNEGSFTIYYDAKKGVVMAKTRRDTRPIAAIIYEMKRKDYQRARKVMTPVWLLKKNPAFVRHYNERKKK